MPSLECASCEAAEGRGDDSRVRAGIGIIFLRRNLNFEAGMHGMHSLLIRNNSTSELSLYLGPRSRGGERATVSQIFVYLIKTELQPLC